MSESMSPVSVARVFRERGPLPAWWVAFHFSATPSRTDAILASLVRKGHLHRLPDGRWALTDGGIAWLALVDEAIAEEKRAEEELSALTSMLTRLYPEEAAS